VRNVQQRRGNVIADRAFADRTAHQIFCSDANHNKHAVNLAIDLDVGPKELNNKELSRRTKEMTNEQAYRRQLMPSRRQRLPSQAHMTTHPYPKIGLRPVRGQNWSLPLSEMGSASSARAP
jgi:hypothetical protein